KGIVTQLPPPEGDKRSNTIFVRDSTGSSFRYAHMIATHFAPGLKEGDSVQQGESLGLTGNYYLDHLSPSPHLHVSLLDENNTYRNTFPVFVEAYRNTYPGELLPIAGNVRHVYAGGEIEL